MLVNTSLAGPLSHLKHIWNAPLGSSITVSDEGKELGRQYSLSSRD